jgi:TonB family protein
MPEFPKLMQNLPEHTDRRTHSRHRIRALAYVELGENNGGIVLNISEGGFGVRAAEAIQEDSLSRLRFQMQYATQPLEMSGKIAWTSESRREAGVRFTDLRDEALSEIRTWILQEVSPGRSPKQFPVARRSFGATPEKNETISDEFSKGEIVEAETQDDADHQVAGPSIIPDSKSKFSGPMVSRAPAERQEYGATLFPKAASTAPGSRLPVTALPAISKPGSVPSVSRAQNAPENWMDFRVQMGRGWMVAALVTFLVAISFSAGMAVRRGGLAGLRRNADTPPSASAQTQNSVPAAPPARTPSKPLQIDIVDSSNQRWTIPANTSAPHSGANGAGIESRGSPHDSSENIATPTSGLRPAPEHQDAGGASAVPSQKGASPTRLSLPEHSVSASGSVAVSSQRSLVVPAESSQSTSPTGKNLQVGQLVNLVDPLYPPEAEQKHIEGTVRIHATIGVDGSIKDLQPLSGPASLLPAALTAVREWRYNPTLLNGQPIETQEDISVVFRLPN